MGLVQDRCGERPLRGVAPAGLRSIAPCPLGPARPGQEATAEGVSFAPAEQEVSRRLLAAQEEERARLARELHDEAGHVLTALRLELGALDGGEQAVRVARCLALTDDALARIRRVVQNLRPPVLDEVGLVPSLSWLLEDAAGNAGWDVWFQAEGRDECFPSSIAVACFRIAQEALTNVARHANATHVRLFVGARCGSIELEVSDDGTGFDLAAQARPGAGRRHFGLASMQERAALLRGRVSIESSPGAGTRVRAAFPCICTRAATPPGVA